MPLMNGNLVLTGSLRDSSRNQMCRHGGVLAVLSSQCLSDRPSGAKPQLFYFPNTHRVADFENVFSTSPNATRGRTANTGSSCIPDMSHLYFFS